MSVSFGDARSRAAEAGTIFGEMTNVHMPAGDDKLQTLVERVVESLDPERIFLFGSVARGEQGGNSDYDLLLVVTSAAEPTYRPAQRAHSTIWGLGISADILVWTKEAFEKRLHLQASLPATVLREGTLLYAA